MKFLTPDNAVPLVAEPKYIDLRDRMDACLATMDYIFDDVDITITDEDVRLANEIVAAFAEDPEVASSHVDTQATLRMRPGTMLMVKAILDEFGHAVVQSTTLIRHLVVNKLIIESENPDPRIRMRALENLGKMSDVALFTERSEVTITHQSTEDLKAKLKAKLDTIRDRATTLHPNAAGIYEVPQVPVVRPNREFTADIAGEELDL